jgi:hypothetical protein
LVTDVFWPEDAEAILMIPTNEDFEDWPAWFYDSKRIFSVKSAYKLAVQLRDQKNGTDASTSSVSNQIADDFKWEILWLLNDPNKIKMFLWRFTHNSLPARRNIVMRGVQTDTVCPVCCRLDEDCDHLFFSYKRVKEVWWELGMEHVRDMLQLCGSGKEVIEKIWTLQEKEQHKI